MKKIDILAFGSHPDDVELGAGGTLLKMKSKGCKTGIVNLTRGEMNSRATPETIAQEANKAAEILKVDIRETLDLGDCRIEDTYKNKITISEIIRKYRPEVVLAPYFIDRHNDHAIGGSLVKSSNLYCRLKKLQSKFPPHGPKLFLFYLLQVKNSVSPTIVVDITEYYNEKIEAVKSYRSQFEKTASEQDIIPIGIGDYLFHIESRDRFYGSLINVKYGEAFISEEPLNIKNLFELISK